MSKGETRIALDTLDLGKDELGCHITGERATDHTRIKAYKVQEELERFSLGVDVDMDNDGLLSIQDLLGVLNQLGF